MVFCIKFWGVRGSIACPSPEHIRYGGNTSCIEVEAGSYRFVLDAGTGIRRLGQAFLRSDVRTLHLLLTHTHWDHINGFPFFAPAYSRNRQIHIMAGHLATSGGVQGVLANQMNNPTFPVPLSALEADLVFEDFKAGESFNLYPEIKIRTAPLNHPNNATGYRIEYGGRSLCYVTDTEHVPGQLDQNILGLIEGADVVIYDSTYSEEEYPKHVGWGHSTWNEGVRLCRAAGARKFVMFHHDPEHTDTIMDDMGRQARQAWADTEVAQEGMVISLD